MIGRAKITFRKGGGIVSRLCPSPPIHKLTNKLDVVSNGKRKNGSETVRSLNHKAPPVLNDCTGTSVMPLNAKNMVMKIAENE